MYGELTFWAKTCVCAFFFLYFECTPPASGSHLVATVAKCGTYTRSLEIFAKTVWPYHPLPNTSLSSELERVLYSVWDRLSIFFCKYFSLYLRMCIFCCTSDTAYWKNSYLTLLERSFQYSPVATFALCSPYTRSLEIFAKTVWPDHPLPNTSLSSELERVLYSVWDRLNLSFFANISHFTCVCAFFVVPSNICLDLPISHAFSHSQFPRSYFREMRYIHKIARNVCKNGLTLSSTTQHFAFKRAWASAV